MKRFLVVALAAGLIAVMWAESGFAAGNVIKLKYGHVERIEDPQHMFAERFAKRVNELTEGRVVIEIYPSGQLGAEGELIDGVQFGSIEMGHHVFASLGKVHKDMPLFGLPYLFRDAAHGLMATNPETSPVMARLNEEMVKQANMRVIGCYTRGFRHLSAKFPVYSPEDLKGKKIRGIPVPMWTTLLKGMGAIPVPVAISELPTALVTGLVVGQENPLGQMWAAKIYETQSHIMLTGHMLDLLPVFVNEAVWNKILEGDHRALIMQAMKEASDYSRMWSEEQEKEYIRLFKEKGVTIIGEQEGLNKEAFKKAVLEQVRKDFPQWAGYVEELQKIGQ
ncbi:MAG: TRAP transporter substrate-binding protein [Acetomicrobium sp.]|nr:TRAP transporter substrate-binding protein [Acetomicrobium sp.]